MIQDLTRLPRNRVIAVIGSDGSGKSTMAAWLATELARDFDTRHMYFGTGDGKGSLLIRSLNWLKQRSRYGKPSHEEHGANSASDFEQLPTNSFVDQRPHNDTDSAMAPSASTSSQSGAAKAPDILRLVWAIAALQERRRKMKSLQEHRQAGRIVVTDRYPQAELAGIHDGPRLGYLLQRETGTLLQRIARWEHRAYEQLARCKPDLVLLLDVTAEVASKRRPDETLEELHRRTSTVRLLRYGNAKRVVLDASAPLKEVKLKAIQAVFDETDADDRSVSALESDDMRETQERTS